PRPVRSRPGSAGAGSGFMVAPFEVSRIDTSVSIRTYRIEIGAVGDTSTMPRHVDRSERRTAVGHALMRIVARDGMEAVSVRSVAAEAGMSVGAVQRYF